MLFGAGFVFGVNFIVTPMRKLFSLVLVALV